jgi:hypothetical protein
MWLFLKEDVTPGTVSLRDKERERDRERENVKCGTEA